MVFLVPFKFTFDFVLSDVSPVRSISSLEFFFSETIGSDFRGDGSKAISCLACVIEEDGLEILSLVSR